MRQKEIEIPESEVKDKAIGFVIRTGFSTKKG